LAEKLIALIIFGQQTESFHINPPFKTEKTLLNEQGVQVLLYKKRQKHTFKPNKISIKHQNYRTSAHGNFEQMQQFTNRFGYRSLEPYTA
jgi:hypothetical protein